jgi:hypothetical protein
MQESKLTLALDRVRDSVNRDIKYRLVDRDPIDATQKIVIPVVMAAICRTNIGWIEWVQLSSRLYNKVSVTNDKDNGDYYGNTSDYRIWELSYQDIIEVCKDYLREDLA